MPPVGLHVADKLAVAVVPAIQIIRWRTDPTEAPQPIDFAHTDIVLHLQAHQHRAGVRLVRGAGFGDGWGIRGCVTIHMVDWDTMDIEIRAGDLSSDAAARLVAVLNAEIRARYDDPVADYVLDLGLAEVEAKRGAFALACAGDDAFGCGAVRLLDADTAELKRLYVRPDYRRQGVARRILRFLEAHAWSLGASRVVLETVTTPAGAVELYASAGYEPIPRFGPYVDSEISYCMGKKLRQG